MKSINHSPGWSSNPKLWLSHHISVAFNLTLCRPLPMVGSLHKLIFFFPPPFHPPPSPSTACLASTLRLSSENHLFEAFSSHPDPNTSVVWRTMFGVFSVISYISLKLLEFQGPGVLHTCNSSTEHSGRLINAGFTDAYEGRNRGTPMGCAGRATFLQLYLLQWICSRRSLKNWGTVTKKRIPISNTWANNRSWCLKWPASYIQSLSVF